MRVLLLTDADFALRERSMLERLAVGIADEGARVALAAPRSVSGSDVPTLIEHVAYDPPFPLLGARVQAELLHESLVERRFTTEAGSLDVIHAFGFSAVELAIALGAIENAGVVLELWKHLSSQEARRIERLARRGETPVELVWSTPSAVMRDEFMALAPGADCRVIPWGVHTPRVTQKLTDIDNALGVVLLVNRRMGAAAATAFTALSSALSAVEQETVVVCDDAVVRRDHRVWRAVRKLGLLDRLSFVSGLEARRAPALAADLVISITEPGEHRSIVLDAMGHGRTVVALDDPRVEWLRDGETCRTTHGPDLESWRSVLSQLIASPDVRASLGESAQAWVRAERSASGQVRELLQLYSHVEHRAAELAEAGER